MGNKVKRIFVGENQVYPVWRYSYDFRNKTLAQIQADGFSVMAGNVTLDSNGLHQNGTPCRIRKPGFNQYMQDAKKVTLTFDFYCADYAIRYALAENVTSSSANLSFGIYLDTRLSEKTLEIGGVNNLVVSGFSSGSHTATAVFDIENKMAYLDVSGYSQMSKALTDTDIANLKTIEYIYISEYEGSGDNYIKTINLAIEY